MASKDITLCISAPRCGFIRCKRNPANHPQGVYSMADFGAGANFKFGCQYMLTAETVGYTPKKEN